MSRSKQKSGGQIIIMFTLFVGFLMGFSALAFDLGYAMIVRAELITALDAAALAAIRYVPDGQAAMTNAANRTFAANLPPASWPSRIRCSRRRSRRPSTAASM